MNSNEQIKIQAIDEKSAYLADVQRLWRANSTRLGMFPEGAFIDSAKRHHILAALDQQENCIGYLLYRIATKYRQVSITHLCIDSKHRNKGVARALVDYLKLITQNWHGIKVLCRRDYEADAIWPRLGFVPSAEKAGRSKDGLPLTYWWFSHRHPSLLTLIDEKQTEGRLKVVMDANVFYDLEGEGGNDESSTLVADWLREDIALCLTNEILNEINRHPDAQQRNRQRAAAQKYTLLETQEKNVQDIVEKLRPLFAKSHKRGDNNSDILQLAHTISASALFFATRDQNILDLSEQIQANFGLLVVRPSELVIRLDELHRAVEYQPVRLAGSQVQFNRVRAGEENSLTEIFQDSSQETQGAFRQRLHHFLADPHIFDTRLAQDATQGYLALIVYVRQSPGKLDIPLFRVARGSLSSTLCRHLTLKSILMASTEQRPLIKVTDPSVTEEVAQALQENAFYKSQGGWFRVGLRLVASAHEIIEQVQLLGTQFPDDKEGIQSLASTLDSIVSRGVTETLWETEKSLWPAKIADTDFPAFIVPIKPVWAEQLFDETLANQTLFGAKEELALNGEHVYYRASQPPIISAPARILWYVSSGRHQGAQHIRACSYVDDVIVGKPKELFRQFRRLGIYDWRDVYATAHRDIQRKIMALRFSGTELFANPIPWKDLQQILEEETGRRSQIQSPLKVPSSCFLHLYQKGFSQNGSKEQLLDNSEGTGLQI